MILRAENTWFKGIEKNCDLVSAIKDYHSAIEFEIYQIIFKYPPAIQVINQTRKQTYQ